MKITFSRNLKFSSCETKSNWCFIQNQIKGSIMIISYPFSTQDFLYLVKWGRGNGLLGITYNTMLGFIVKSCNVGFVGQHTIFFLFLSVDILPSRTLLTMVNMRKTHLISSSCDVLFVWRLKNRKSFDMKIFFHHQNAPLTKILCVNEKVLLVKLYWVRWIEGKCERPVISKQCGWMRLP